jgi:cation:H+ antiporter
MFMDGNLDFIDGVILIAALVGYSLWLIKSARGGSSDEGEQAGERPDMRRALMWVGIGGLLLPLSARLLVWGASGVARDLGVSELIIGLTIVALGTSLPELAASVAGALKGEHEMVVGNIIGSNVFNLMAVLGVPGLISPGAVAADVLTRDLPVMVGVVILLIFLMFLGRKNQQLGRISGFVLLCSYLAYLFEVIRQTQAG